MAVDQEEIIREIVSFQENCATTTGSIEPIVQEKQLVQDFLSKIPLIQLFQCLEEASVQAQEKQVSYVDRASLCRVHFSTLYVFFS
jgi:hypothetical protein